LEGLLDALLGSLLTLVDLEVKLALLLSKLSNTGTLELGIAQLGLIHLLRPFVIHLLHNGVEEADVFESLLGRPSGELGNLFLYLV